LHKIHTITFDFGGGWHVQMLPAGGEELANSGQFQPPKSLFARTFGEVPHFPSSVALFGVAADVDLKDR
jgi:hypothetical protein